ncbi:MAG: thrombospondin type 3 repeat-containing protein [Gemmatimonadota bacterium]
MRILGLAAVALCFMGAWSSSHAQMPGVVELSAGGVWVDPGNSLPAGHGFGGGGSIGIRLPSRFSLEANGFATTGMTSYFDGGKTSSFGVGGRLLYNLALGSRGHSVFVNAGYGYHKIGGVACQAPRDPWCSAKSGAVAGVGLRLMFVPGLALRGDAGGHFGRGFVTKMASIGLSFIPGSRPASDADRDGVPDNRDRCANTPLGALVNRQGCPTDFDKDGVPDGLDRCPNTPPGAVVDTFGCSEPARRPD